MASKTRPLFLRLAALLLVILAIVSSMTLQASAESSSPAELIPSFEWTQQLTGEYTGKFDLTSEDMELFNLENIAPGDSFVGKIHVKNNARDKMEISIISIVSNLEDLTLFDALELEIKVEDEIVYTGSYGKTEAPISDFYLISPRDTVTFDVTVSLPIETGNEVLNKKMDSTWTFEANYYNRPVDDDDEYRYIVNYLDEDGNELLPSKTGWAEYGEKVTERAKDIRGYVVDKDVKSIIMKRHDNVINFIYRKSINTGVDLTEGNTGSGLWPFMSGVCILAIAVLLSKICYERRRAKTVNETTSLKEADSKNEK